MSDAVAFLGTSFARRMSTVLCMRFSTNSDVRLLNRTIGNGTLDFGTSLVDVSEPFIPERFAVKTTCGGPLT